MSNSTTITTINYSECIQNNGGEKILYVRLVNVVYQLQWLHNDEYDMAELGQSTGRGECAGTKNLP
jgi:hypothetical protein